MSDDLASGLAGLIAPVVVGGVVLKVTEEVFGKPKKPKTGRRYMGGPSRASGPSSGNFKNVGY